MGRHLKVPADIPVPVHESMEEFVPWLAYRYERNRYEDEMECFSMQLSEGLRVESRDEEEKEDTVCYESEQLEEARVSIESEEN